MLKENEILKVRPVLIARLDEPDAEAVEVVLQEHRLDGVYERSVAMLGEVCLSRFQSSVEYMRKNRSWAECVDGRVD